MVARAETQQRIAIAFEAIEAALDDLPEVTEEWQTLPEGERVSWSLDWDHLMGTYLVILERYQSGKELTREQESRYCALKAKLRAALPTINRLNLHRPPVPIE
jgi:hypothetical protein